MNKLIFLLLISVILTVGCKDDKEEDLPVSAQVQMSANAFLPQTLTVTAGTSVRWHNSSQVDHTVTSSDGFFDEFLSAGEAFIYTFTTAGTYNYVCTLHAGMSGVIIVE